MVIELSDEERAELERRVACYTLPHKVVMRAKMILYAAEGQPPVADSAPLSGRPQSRTRTATGGSGQDPDPMLTGSCWLLE
jgi:hypothetical protein